MNNICCVQYSPVYMSAIDKVAWVFCSLNSCHFLMEEFRKAIVKLSTEVAQHFNATLSGKYFQSDIQLTAWSMEMLCP